MQIVIAWATRTKLIPAGSHIKLDLNWYPAFNLGWEGHACMWLNKGTEADFEQARKHCSSDYGIEGSNAYQFDFDVKDPLGKARELAVAAAHEADRRDLAHEKHHDDARS